MTFPLISVVSRMKFRKKPVPKRRDFLVTIHSKNGIMQPFWRKNIAGFPAFWSFTWH